MDDSDSDEYLTDSDGNVPLRRPLDVEEARRQHRARLQRWRQQPSTDPMFAVLSPLPPPSQPPPQPRQRRAVQRYSPPPTYPTRCELVLLVDNIDDAQQRILTALDADRSLVSHECAFAVEQCGAERKLRVCVRGVAMANPRAAQNAAKQLRRVVLSALK